MLRPDTQLRENVADTAIGVGDNYRFMPVVSGVQVLRLKENIAEKSVRIEDESGRTTLIGKDDPLFTRRLNRL